jgi:flagellar M-ring protein FliF
VAADMNYESAERVEETFTTPDGAPALNESTETEEYEGSGGGAAGVLGPDNIAVPGDAAGDGMFTSESETKNNALNKVTETRAIPAGAINRQTVSVALDADAAGALNLANIEGLVTTAAGINADRGDEVTVELVPFNTAGAQDAAEALAAAQAAEEAARQAELIRTAIITAGIVLLVIIALLVYARWSRRQNREPVDLGELQDFQPEIEAPQDLQLPRPVIVPEPIPVVAPSTTALELTGPPELSDEQKDMNRKRAEIDALAAQEPDKTADFLRSLMDEKQNA